MLCIIQARLGSTRLKNKLCLKINQHKLIEWVLIRSKKIKKITKVVLAVPNKKSQKPLIDIAKKYDCDFYLGSENNLIKRFLDILKYYKQKKFIRLCADNPFLCHKEIDNLISFFHKKKVDYAYNHRPINNSYPDGLGAEISNLKTLLNIKSMARTKAHKEHLFNSLLENPSRFKIATMEPKNKYYRKPFLRLDIDFINQLNSFKKLNINPYMDSASIIKKILKS